MGRFQTVLKSARFVYSPYTATEMQGFAQVLTDSIRARIQSGQNIYDQAAAPLKPGRPGRRGYPDYKSARGLQPIRDWTWSGPHPAMAMHGVSRRFGNMRSFGTSITTARSNDRSLGGHLKPANGGHQESGQR